MYKAFEKESILAYAAFLVLIALAFVQVCIHPHLITSADTSFIFRYVLPISGWNIYLIKGIAFVSTIVVLIIYSRFYRTLGFYYKSGLLIQSILLINLIISYSFNFRLESIISILIIFLILYFLVNGEAKKQTIQLFFQVGVLYGFSLLLSLENLLYSIAILLSIFIYGKSGWRDLAALILGFLVPFYIAVTYFMLTDQSNWVMNHIQIIKTVHYDPVRNYEWIVLIIVGLSAIIAIPAVSTYNIQTRKFFTFILINLLVILPIFILLSLNEGKPILCMMTISSFYFNSYFYRIKRGRMKNVLLFLGFLLAFIATFVSLN